MRVTVNSPEAAIFDVEADAVNAPAYDGQVGILPHHAPFMTLLGSGILTVRAGENEHQFHVDGGFLQAVNNTVRIVAEKVKGHARAS